MDLHAEYAPKIEAALARMAPGEKIGWTLAPATGSQQTTPGGKQTQVRVYQLTMFSPAPILGMILHWQQPFIDPFAPLANDGALLDEAVAAGLATMRKIASEMLTKPS